MKYFQLASCLETLLRHRAAFTPKLTCTDHFGMIKWLLSLTSIETQLIRPCTLYGYQSCCVQIGRSGKGAAQLASEAASKGAESTKHMQAGAGRSSYIPDSEIHGIPDPGAMAVAIWMQGISDALSGGCWGIEECALMNESWNQRRPSWDKKSQNCRLGPVTDTSLWTKNNLLWRYFLLFGHDVHEL